MARTVVALALAAAWCAPSAGLCPDGPLLVNQDCRLFSDCCVEGTRCFRRDAGFAACLPACPPAGPGTWDCAEVTCAAGVPEAPPVNAQRTLERHGKLRVHGVQLVDSNGEAVQLTGFTTAPFLRDKCAHKDGIAALAGSWGLDVIRASVPVGTNGVAKPVTAESMEELVKIVRHAELAGIYVVIDFGVFSPGDPNAFLTSVSPPAGPAIDFWREVAEMYKTSSHVMYDISGQPNLGADGQYVSWARLKRYHDAVIGEIRRIDPSTVILVGTPRYNQLLEGPGSNPVAQPHNVMYNVMFAAASDSLDTIRAAVAPWRGQLPLFLAGIKAGDHAMRAPPRLDVLRIALDFARGGPGEASLSWAALGLHDSLPLSSAFLPGSCSDKVIDRLTCTGTFLRNYMRHTKQAKWPPTSAPTGSPTGSPTTSSPTATPTATPTALRATSVPIAAPSVQAPTPGVVLPTARPSVKLGGSRAPTRALVDSPDDPEDASGISSVVIAASGAAGAIVGLVFIVGAVRALRGPPSGDSDDFPVVVKDTKTEAVRPESKPVQPVPLGSWFKEIQSIRSSRLPTFVLLRSRSVESKPSQVHDSLY